MSDIPHLNSLEFEDLELSRGKNREVNDSKGNSPEEQILIVYSSGVVVALNKLMKAHNKECEENKVSLKELKKVFRRGADCKEAKESNLPCGVLAMARVNMFLRLKSGEIMKASSSPSCLMYLKSIDISDCWYPTEQDFSKASEYMKSHDLNHDFKNINNLYLDEYTKIELEY